MGMKDFHLGTAEIISESKVKLDQNGWKASTRHDANANDGSQDARHEAIATAGREIVIDLPLPPSTNNLFPSGGNKKRRFASPEYRAWKRTAAQIIRDSGFKAWTGRLPVSVIIIVRNGRGWYSKISDIANREKAPTDAMVDNGILPQDTAEYIADIRIVYDDKKIGDSFVTIVIREFDGDEIIKKYPRNTRVPRLLPGSFEG